MPVFRQRMAAEVARGVKAFLNLEAGLVRGEVPNLAQMLEKAQKQLKQKNRQLKKARQRAKQFRQRVLTQNQRMTLWRERLVTDAREISRLQQQVYSLLSEERKAAGPDALRSGTASIRKADGRNGQTSSEVSASALYLDLMKNSLKHTIYDEPQLEGGIWPSTAHTMIGFQSLDNLQFCVEDVLANDVPGDFIETGVWRGGASILMRAALKAHGVENRTVWVADSFEGLPPPNPEKYPHDAGDKAYTATELAISLEEVQSNFQRYGLLDDQVRFLKGWFSDTLPDAPIEKLAVARLDGDMYESTMDALTNLYPKLSVGGYLIVDDYGAVPACRQAVHDYREANDIDEEIHSIDQTGVFWQRAK